MEIHQFLTKLKSMITGIIKVIKKLQMRMLIKNKLLINLNHNKMKLKIIIIMKIKKIKMVGPTKKLQQKRLFQTLVIQITQYLKKIFKIQMKIYS